MKISKLCSATALLTLLGNHAVAATLTVTDLGDAGTGLCGATCTLRDAIASAAPNDTIDFASTLTYPATITLNGNELLVYKDMTILGPGAGLLAIDANQQSRVLEIAANATVTLSGVALNNGTVAGANGADAPGPSMHAGPGTDAYGGGAFVHAGSSLQLIACRLNGNQALGGIGGFATFFSGRHGDGGSAHGGAIYSAGTLSIKDSSLTGNIAYGGRAGGPIPRSARTACRVTAAARPAEPLRQVDSPKLPTLSFSTILRKAISEGGVLATPAATAAPRREAHWRSRGFPPCRLSARSAVALWRPTVRRATRTALRASRQAPTCIQPQQCSAAATS